MNGSKNSKNKLRCISISVCRGFNFFIWQTQCFDFWENPFKIWKIHPCFWIKRSYSWKNPQHLKQVLQRHLFISKLESLVTARIVLLHWYYLIWWVISLTEVHSLISRKYWNNPLITRISDWLRLNTWQYSQTDSLFITLTNSFHNLPNTWTEP